MLLFRFSLDSPDEVHTSFIEVKLKTIFILYLIKITDNSTDGNRCNYSRVTIMPVQTQEWQSRVTVGMTNRCHDSPVTDGMII